MDRNSAQFLAELEKELAPLGVATTAPALDALRDDVTSLNNSTKVSFKCSVDVY